VLLTDKEGNEAGDIRIGAPVDFVAPIRTGGGKTSLLVAEKTRHVVPVDFDGDGRDEVAMASRADTVVVLDDAGRLIGRITFEGDRITLAAGDVDGVKGEELVVGGEGVGVAVLSVKPRVP
jgi:hypothetical protein